MKKLNFNEETLTITATDVVEQVSDINSGFVKYQIEQFKEYIKQYESKIKELESILPELEELETKKSKIEAEKFKASERKGPNPIEVPVVEVVDEAVVEKVKEANPIAEENKAKK